MSTTHFLAPLKTHEDFSLTGMLLKKTSKWHQESDIGSLGARIVNLVATPLTASIDTVAHLALSMLTIGGLSELGVLYNGCAWLFSSQSTWPFTFTGGLINLYQALNHSIAIVAAPILGFASPLRAEELFAHLASQAADEQRKKIIKSEDHAQREKRAKEHVVNNLRKLRCSLAREINVLKGKCKHLASGSKLGIEANIKTARTFRAKIVELETENSDLQQKNKQLAEQNSALKKQLKELKQQAAEANKEKTASTWSFQSYIPSFG